MLDLQIDHAFFHQVCIYTLLGCLALLAFIVIERLVYYGLFAMRSSNIRGAIEGRSGGAFGDDSVGKDFAAFTRMARTPGVGRDQVEDLSSALYLRVDSKVNARLWILDTIVTAAPLLGLLGTILGIMDTFNALSSGGISDPAAVSRGIAAALIATAIGIGTALFGLLAHNLLHRQTDVLLNSIKISLLEAAKPSPPAAQPAE